MSEEYAISRKNILKILCKSKHFPWEYKENMSGCFFLNTV